jgi:hypothetical protein
MQKAVWVRSLLVLLLLLVMGHAATAQVAVGISVGFAPPELPVYDQPPCPADGYLWTPGYWAWDPDAGDYYWVPGTWVEAPEVGFFWTPPYWGWEGGRYFFHAGWWGPHVGFYGGISYGFGYFGHGYEGGRWDGGHFFYNRFVNNVNVTVVHNVYETRIDNRIVTHVSFNGGTGGIQARATAEEEGWGRERHVEATRVQTEHINAARANVQFRASSNHGRPPVAATGRPGEFSGHEAVAARSGAEYHPPANREGGGGGENRPANAGHVKDLPPAQHMAAPNSGNAQRDQKFQQQQDKLFQKQNQERQNLQAKQEQEHQKAQQQHYNAAKQQQMEQRHTQQTQQLQQKHEQQTQHLQQRQAAPAHGGSHK